MFQLKNKVLTCFKKERFKILEKLSNLIYSKYGWDSPNVKFDHFYKYYIQTRVDERLIMYRNFLIRSVEEYYNTNVVKDSYKDLNIDSLELSEAFAIVSSFKELYHIYGGESDVLKKMKRETEEDSMFINKTLEKMIKSNIIEHFDIYKDEIRPGRHVNYYNFYEHVFILNLFDNCLRDFEKNFFIYFADIDKKTIEKLLESKSVTEIKSDHQENCLIKKLLDLFFKYYTDYILIEYVNGGEQK